MANWRYQISYGKDLRKAIKEENGEQIMKIMKMICRRCMTLFDEDSSEYWDFEVLHEEIEEQIELEAYDTENVDYYLSNLYDSCDAARVWLMV